MRKYNLIGERFERLVVLSLDHRNKYGTAYYICQCDCGKQVIVRGNHLTDNSTKSCGCYSIDTCYKMVKINTKHNLSHSKLYRVWSSMIHRCYNPNCRAYKDYGGRGIKVCDEWKDNLNIFYDWALNNNYMEGLSIDRINNNGNYEPSNCRWVSRKKQQNNRRNNHYITYNNETHTLTEWSEILHISTSTLFSRICKSKWDIERAFTTPVRECKRKRGENARENNN